MRAVAPLCPSSKLQHACPDFSKGSGTIDAIERVAEVHFEKDLIGISIATAPLAKGVDGHLGAQGRPAANLKGPEQGAGLSL